MIAISLTDCPAALRGDLTKWLLEIDTGVFVGQVSARVREQLWQRVQKSARNGRATMVFNSNTEQGLDFKVHNSNWLPIDFDGLKLILRPASPKITTIRPGYSKASRFLMARRASKRRNRQTEQQSGPGQGPTGAYAVVDLETTGLNPEKDAIIMLSALKVVPGQADSVFESFVRTDIPIAAQITKLTGISSETLVAKGKELKDVMGEFTAFTEGCKLVAHNISFDLAFLGAARKKLQLKPLVNETIDTLALARKKLHKLKDHKLATVAQYFGINAAGMHNASTDCAITKEVYERLIKESE
jgi:CRISPR-associated protein Cas2